MKSVKFDNVTKITELGAYAMAYCSQLSSVNGKTTEAGATALFSNANVGYKPFYNTALNGASSSDNFFKEMRGQKSLKINESQMNISVSTNNDNDLDWISNPTIGETEVGGYKTLTGTTLNIISSISTSVHDDINYRVYFELTEPDGILGISPGETQNAKGIDLSGKEYSIPVTCYATEAPNITYIEFAPKEGITASIYLNAVYSNYISSGGGLRVWGVMQSREESQATKGHIIPYTVNNNKNETIEMYWTTVADDFKLTKSSTGNSTVELIGNSEKGILPKDKLSYSITFERLSASTANYGKDIVKEVDYYDIIKLPDGVKWADDVLANIKAGNVRSSNKSTYENNVRLSNKSVYAGNVQIIDIKNGNNSNALNTYDLNVTYNEEEQNVVISWKSYNNDIKAEIGTTKFLFDIYPDAIRADSALTELTDKTVTNNVTANVKYTYSADRQLSSSAKKDFKLKSAELQFSRAYLKSQYSCII